MKFNTSYKNFNWFKYYVFFYNQNNEIVIGYRQFTNHIQIFLSKEKTG